MKEKAYVFDDKVSENQYECTPKKVCTWAILVIADFAYAYINKGKKGI